MLKISQRAKDTLASPTRRFLPYILAAEAKGIEVIKLNVGDPDIAPPTSLLKTIKSYPKTNLAYAPSPGIKQHVAAWQKYYQQFSVKLTPNQIVPTAGCAEAILFALLAVTDPGDEVLIFEPFYANYQSFASMASIRLKAVTLKIENNFTLPPTAEIEKHITTRTKAIVVINPNNPTGSVLSPAEIKRLIAIARHKKLFIIADETYREIVFQAKPSTFLKFANTTNSVIMVDSTSKRFSCPGARIGCVVSRNPEVMFSILKFAMSRLSAPTLEQYGLVPVLCQPKNYIKQLVSQYKTRQAVVVNEIKKLKNVTCAKPQGAFYTIIKLPVLDAQKFVEYMLRNFSYHKKTVALPPAKDFYLTKNLGLDEVRLAYVVPPKTLIEAIKILGHGLEAYNKKLSKK